jgi:hypothetical protein
MCTSRLSECIPARDALCSAVTKQKGYSNVLDIELSVDLTDEHLQAWNAKATASQSGDMYVCGTVRSHDFRDHQSANCTVNVKTNVVLPSSGDD